jgi:hypothetical protein
MNTLYRDIIRSGQARDEWYASGMGYVYLLRVKHYRGRDKALIDEFIKIGFTHQPDVRDRVASMPKCYKVEIVDTIVMDEATAYNLEQYLHKNLKEHHYFPMYKKWAGVTECYSKRLLLRYHTLFDILQSIIEEKVIEAHTPKFYRL